MVTLSGAVAASDLEVSLRDGLRNSRRVAEKARGTKSIKGSKAPKSPKTPKSSKAPKSKVNKSAKSTKSPKAIKSNVRALFEFDIDVTGEVQPSKMDIGPDNKIYFTGSNVSQIWRVDNKGNAELFAAITDGAGYTLGIEFDDQGNLYLVNGLGLFRIAADKMTGPLPISPTLFSPWGGIAPIIPHGIGIDNSNSQAYVADMGKGEILKINLKTGANEVWASSADSTEAYVELLGDLDSTNFIGGLPLGVTDVMVDAQSEWLYFSNHERNQFGRVKILSSGGAGDLQVLDVVDGRAALNGAYLDRVNNKLYAVTPFTNFQNGGVREPLAKLGGQIWMIDINDINEDGTGGKAKLIVDDKALGTPVDIITGRNFGNPSDLYTLDGSYDTQVWPTGIIPDEDATYHAAVRMVKGGAGSSKAPKNRRK